MYHDFIYSDDLNNDNDSQSYPSYGLYASSSSSPDAETPSQTIPTDRGEKILRDMFLSRRVIGIRASLFHSSIEHLRKVCSLHGIDVSGCSKVRDVKIRLLYHIINGDCFLQHCESSHPVPDRSACLCIAGSFPSSLSITSFIENLLKTSIASQITTEELLLVVESTGNQLPYENQRHMRRRVLGSLQAFVVRCRHLTQ